MSSRWAIAAIQVDLDKDGVPDVHIVEFGRIWIGPSTDAGGFDQVLQYTPAAGASPELEIVASISAQGQRVRFEGQGCAVDIRDRLAATGPEGTYFSPGSRFGQVFLAFYRTAGATEAQSAMVIPRYRVTFAGQSRCQVSACIELEPVSADLKMP